MPASEHHGRIGTTQGTCPRSSLCFVVSFALPFLRPSGACAALVSAAAIAVTLAPIHSLQNGTWVATWRPLRLHPSFSLGLCRQSSPHPHPSRSLAYCRCVHTGLVGRGLEVLGTFSWLAVPCLDLAGVSGLWLLALAPMSTKTLPPLREPPLLLLDWTRQSCGRLVDCEIARDW